jgi:hypothetical protein
MVIRSVASARGFISVEKPSIGKANGRDALAL